MTEMDQFQASEERLQRCVICNHVSHGYHFGILSCRACAAFFRRTITENKDYKCRDGMNCVISREQRSMCKACRYKKCEQNGMNKNEIQFNRDPICQKMIFKSEKSTFPTPSHGHNYIPISSTHFNAPSNPINMPENYNPPLLTTLEQIDVGCKEYFFGRPIPGRSDHSNQPSICTLNMFHILTLSSLLPV